MAVLHEHADRASGIREVEAAVAEVRQDEGRRDGIPECNTCRAFRLDLLNDPYGECRRRCPQVIPLGDADTHDAVWPTVHRHNDGCLDWLPAEAPR